MVACVECDEQVIRGASDVISCDKCKNLIHLSCANINITKKQFEKLKKGANGYVCAKCNGKVTGDISGSGDQAPNKMSDNKHSGSKDPLALSVSQSNVSVLSTECLEAIQVAVKKGQSSLLSDISKHMSKMFTAFESKIDKHFESINNAISTMKYEITDNTRRIGLLEVDSSSQAEDIANVKTCNNRINDDLTRLESAINYQDQLSLLTSLEVHGLPFEVNENIVIKFLNVAKALDTDLVEQDIANIYRLKKNGDSINANIPPITIVKLTRQILRDNLIAKRKERKIFLTDDIGLTTGGKWNIYLNESLTHYNRRIYSAALNLRREKKLKYVWISNGKIFYRKDDGEQRYQLLGLDDLKKIK